MVFSLIVRSISNIECVFYQIQIN